MSNGNKNNEYRNNLSSLLDENSSEMIGKEKYIFRYFEYLVQLYKEID